jgi:hypothetical protein
MATDAQVQAAKFAAGVTGVARLRVAREVDFTIAGNTTVKQGITLPAGSIFRGITLDTPTAITNTPTHCYFRAGITDTGQEIVADVDAQAQGHITTTIVAALDNVGGFLVDTPIFLQTVTSGASSAAGTIRAIVDYDAPVQ